MFAPAPVFWPEVASDHELRQLTPEITPGLTRSTPPVPRGLGAAFEQRSPPRVSAAPDEAPVWDDP